MKRIINTILIILVLMFISTGCAKKVCLKYDQCAGIPMKDSTISNNKIGVFTFADHRGEIPANAYGTVIQMVAAELPIAYQDHKITETSISDYVTSSLKKEIANLGAQLSEGSVYLQSIPFENYKSQLDDISKEDADRIIIGRIRFFRWTQAGFAGLAFQGAMPNNLFFTEIQVMVINPEDRKILWAGNGCAKIVSSENYPDTTLMENRIYEGLKHALSSILNEKEFLDSLS